MVENLYRFKKDLDKHGTVLCFSGTITQDVLVTFGELIEVKLREGFPDAKGARDLFAVFVELMQNIMNYSSDSRAIGEGKRESQGIVVVGINSKNGKFFVKSGNNVSLEAKERILSKLDSVTNLNDDELKMAYKEARKSGKDMHPRGGGLGFLEIQRKCSEPLEYKFDKIDSNTLFFNLMATI